MGGRSGGGRVALPLLASTFFLQPLLAARYKLIKGRLYQLQMLCLLLFIGVSGHLNGWRDENCNARKGLGKFCLIPAFPEHPGALRNDVEAKNASAAEAGKLHHTRLGHEAGTTRPVRRYRCLPALAQGANHLHQDARGAAATGSARGGVPVPMNDIGNEFAVKILAYHHHHSLLAPVPDGGENFAVPESDDKTLSTPHRFVVILLPKNFPAQATANQQHHEITHPRCQKQLDALPDRERTPI